MTTFATMYGGGEGAGLGARAAGLEHLWGIEYSPDIAAVAEANGFEMIVSSTLTVNYKDLPAPFWLHASPPCVHASTANTLGAENETDLLFARAIVTAVDVLSPEWVSIENVPAYGMYQSFDDLKNGLEANGYKTVHGIINAANLGVPQTRRRLFLIAGKCTPPRLPNSTHTSAIKAQQLRFDTPPLIPWAGWYDAIEDLIPTLEPDKLSKWQLEMMRHTSNQYGLIPSNKFGVEQFRVREYCEPAHEVIPHIRPRAILLNGENSSSKTQRTGDQPSMTIGAGAGYKAVLRAIVEERVVRLTPAALARLQGVPRDYALPDDRRLAGRVIGNMVPPPVMQAIIEANTNREESPS